MSGAWANLPEELLTLILSKLLVREDQLTFGLVCRPWYDVVPLFHHYPCLMSYQKMDRMWKLSRYDSISYNDIPELHNKDIRCSKYGWLLVSGQDDNGSLFFFNPFNKQMIELPHEDEFCATISFFNLPTSSHCLVVGMSSIAFRSIKIGILKKEDDEWTNFEVKKTKTQFVPSSCSPVLHRGLLYFLDTSGNIRTFDTNKVIWKMYSICPSPQLRDNVEQNFLIKPKGEQTIYAVFVVHDERVVKVYKLLEKQMKWQLVEDLGNKVFFVSHTASFGAIASLKSMRNKIYFTKLHGKSGVFYSLDTKKYHSIDGVFSSDKPYGLKEIDFATWVMPPISDANFDGELTWGN